MAGGTLRWDGPPGEALAPAGGATSDMVVLGSRGHEDKLACLSDIDVAVRTSRHEGVPRVPREAVAMGTPILVTPATNLVELVIATGGGWAADATIESIKEAFWRAAGDVGE